ncbi:MAG: flippase [Candidatus Competibacteraceae bacterium]
MFGEAFLLLLSGGVLFIVISRVAGPELFGQYSLIIAWIMLFERAASFGIPELIMRETGIHGQESGRHVVHGLAIGLVAALLAMSLMASLVFLFGYTQDTRQAVLIGSLALVPMMVNVICRSAFLARRQMHWVFLVALLETSILMGVTITLVVNGSGVIPLVTTVVVAKWLSAVLSLGLLHRFTLALRLVFDWAFCKQMLRPVVAFGAGNVLGMVSVRLNTIMVSIWGSMVTVGHFAAAVKVLDIALMLPNLLAQLLMPSIARLLDRQDHCRLDRFHAVFRAIFWVTMPLGIGVIIFAETVVGILFGTEFGGSVWVLRLLMVYFMIEVADILMSLIMRAAHRERADVRLYAINPVTNVALNLVLIPDLGGIGAAIGKVAGVVVSAVLRYRYIAGKLARVRWLDFAIRPILVSAMIGSATMLLFGGVNGVLRGLGYVVACILVIYMLRVISVNEINHILHEVHEESAP